jgi:hypothetical protein
MTIKDGKNIAPKCSQSTENLVRHDRVSFSSPPPAPYLSECQTSSSKQIQTKTSEKSNKNNSSKSNHKKNTSIQEKTQVFETIINKNNSKSNNLIAKQTKSYEVDSNSSSLLY